MTSQIPGFFAIVPAGGAGTRLWPLSRARHPKFLTDVTNAGRTLLQSTMDRLIPLAGVEQVVLVTGRHHIKAAQAQLPALATESILGEPSPRDSMAAIGLAAAVLRERHGNVVVGSFAADHVITGQSDFERAVRQAVVAAHAGYVVTIGIAASRPSTAFGYVRSGHSLHLANAAEAVQVLGFTEKPDASTARRYLVSGEYRWNAGMYVAQADVLLNHLAEQCPQLHEGILQIARGWDSANRDQLLDSLWPHLERIAIDHAIAEPVAAAGGVALVPGSFGWDDVGDFNSLAALLPAVDDAGSKVLGDDALVVRADSAGSVVVPAGQRVIAILGVDDIVVVDTPDALLITTRARAQQVKDMVDRVGERGFSDVL